MISTTIMYSTTCILVAAYLFVLEFSLASAGYCNPFSINCGAPCSIQGDCPNGDCWADKPDCSGGNTGYCSPSSINCGAPCNVQSDCPNGDCWADKPDCDGGNAGYCSPSSANCGAPCNVPSDCPGGDCWADKPDCDGGNAGYCSPSSTNCGAPCNVQGDCPNGDCWADKPDCNGGGSTAIVGTYIGAYPNGLPAPPLSSMSKSINLVMLSFAIDSEHDGKFKPFDGWISNGLTWDSINTDKQNNPGRKYLVSLGGDAAYGGTFDIQAGMSTETWIQNSVDSVSQIIYEYGADGAEMQFEGGTGHSSFHDAMIGLIDGLKWKGFTTAIGPYYGGTWGDYNVLPMTNTDYVNLQLYATGTSDVSGIVTMINQAVQDLQGDWSKLIAGFNTANRLPNPNTALQAVSQLKTNLRGIFSWDAEHSVSNRPPYCLEENAANILNLGQNPGDCRWS